MWRGSVALVLPSVLAWLWYQSWFFEIISRVRRRVSLRGPTYLVSLSVCCSRLVNVNCTERSIFCNVWRCFCYDCLVRCPRVCVSGCARSSLTEATFLHCSCVLNTESIAWLFLALLTASSSPVNSARDSKCISSFRCTSCGRRVVTSTWMSDQNLPNSTNSARAHSRECQSATFSSRKHHRSSHWQTAWASTIEELHDTTPGTWKTSINGQDARLWFESQIRLRKQ